MFIEKLAPASLCEKNMHLSNDNPVTNQPLEMKRKTEHLRRNQHQSSRRRALSYESPLENFKESLEELISFVNNFMRKKRLTSGSLELNRRNGMSLSRDSSPQNSIIVLSDSDNETSNRANSSVIVIERGSSLRRTPLRRSRMFKLHNKTLKDSSRQTKRSSVILLDDDSSFVHPLHTQEPLLKRKSINEENIAPSQAEDDVVEVWSCLGSSSKGKNAPKEKCDKKEENFMIDIQPNLNNLQCLKTKESSRKRRREHCDALNESRKKRRREKVADSKFKQLKERAFSKSHAEKDNKKSKSNHRLREIVVDGCNVAMAHTYGKEFSERGIGLVVDYFKTRGHVVKVFLPQHIRRKNYQFLEELYKEGTVIFTPSRFIAGRKITPYDDRYILEYATKCKGIVISSDQYRDLYEEKPEWRDTILNRLLSPTFVGDYLMFPEDPLGQNGPDIETFLRH